MKMDEGRADKSADKNWPSWRYGPNGQGGVFARESDVPSGWEDHPSKVSEEKKPEAPNTGGDSAEPVGDLDSDGWPFDPAIHDPARVKTNAGKWQLLPGKPRPAPKIAPLDL